MKTFMTYFNFDDLSYMDLGWYALDSRDCIAILFSGATGIIPSSLTVENHKLLDDYFVNAAPAICESLDDPGWEHLWLDVSQKFSKKGLYTYSVESVHDDPYTYYRYTRPSIPVNIFDIPEQLREILEIIRLDISFEASRKIEKNTIPSIYRQSIR